ncbi:MAG: winged helix-turn-helix transcriptional regulator [Candidatus Lokiarchaeota archaeon]|nr:winged helix-turn-helix transcriptional regulator [Candidatus Lokiarchaeota archaeon]
MSSIIIQSGKYKRNCIIKIIFFIFSLVLLSIITFFLIELYKWDVLDPEIDTLKSLLLYLLIPTILLVSILTALTVNDYRNYFIRRSYIKEGRSYLSLADIFQNENRINILRKILDNPGIHHNELLRSCDLKKGQLQWHIDTLLKHCIVKKEKYGQYTIYFPITTSAEAIEVFKNKFAKSKTTLEVLNTIKKHPGINSGEISRILNLSRNSIKYHIDKLLKQHFIRLEKKGRVNELYLTIP